MTVQSHQDTEERGRILRFEPRRMRPSAPSVADDLGKYARDDQTEDDYPHRMKTNAAALVVVTVLIWCGYWLFDALADIRRSQDCVLSGRLACTPIKLSIERR